MDRWRAILVERGSPEHRIFVAYLRRLMCGLEYTIRHARLAHLAMVAERTDPSFRSYVEQEKARMTSSPRRALLLVATERERDAVIRAVELADGLTRPKRDFLPHHTGFHLGIHGDVELILVQSEMGTESPGSMTLTAADVVNAYRPDYLILCGIAFGLREREQAIGDILVSTQIRLWDPKKVSGSGNKPATILRGDKVSASVKLVDRFRSATTDWAGALSEMGQTHSLLTRSVFGRAGSWLVSGFILVAPLGWVGFTAGLLAQVWVGLHDIGHLEVLTIVLAVVMIGANLFGFVGISAYARYVVAPLMIIWVLWFVLRAAVIDAEAFGQLPAGNGSV
jgi:nucleoside phosphorylase